MSLSAIGNPAWESIRGVRFSMTYGPTLIPILVSHDALESLEPPTSDVGGGLACFNKHRDAVELAASAKHDRRQLEEDGSVYIQASDLAC